MSSTGTYRVNDSNKSLILDVVPNTMRIDQRVSEVSNY